MSGSARLTSLGKEWLIRGLFPPVGKLPYDEIRFRSVSKRLMVVEFLYKDQVIAEGPSPLFRVIKHDLSVKGIEGYLPIVVIE